MNILQQLEQMSAFLRDFSPLLFNYKHELMKQGFSEEEAFKLVRDYQKVTLGDGKK